MVADQLNEKSELKFNKQFVRGVLKLNLGMRYKRIKDAGLQTNSDKNLVLRQRYAMELVSLLD